MGLYYDHQVGRFDPPDPIRDRDILLARAREARAAAIADMVGALWAGLKTSAKTLVRHAGSRAALRSPLADVRHHKQAHLTGGCD
jgi:hypothetical protein